MPDGSDWSERWEPPYVPRKMGWMECLRECISIFLAFLPGLMILFVPIGAVVAIILGVWVSPRSAAVPAFLVILDVLLILPVYGFLAWLEHLGVEIG